MISLRISCNEYLFSAIAPALARDYEELRQNLRKRLKHPEFFFNPGVVKSCELEKFINARNLKLTYKFHVDSEHL